MKFKHNGSSVNSAIELSVFANLDFKSTLEIATYSRELPVFLPRREVQLQAVDRTDRVMRETYAEDFVVVLVNYRLSVTSEDYTINQQFRLRLTSGRHPDLRSAAKAFEDQIYKVGTELLDDQLQLIRKAIGLPQEAIDALLTEFKHKTLGDPLPE